MTLKKFDVISPDGFPISSEPFASKKEALDYIPRWCERYQAQGFYSAVGYRIPLEALPDYLQIAEIE